MIINSHSGFFFYFWIVDDPVLYEAITSFLAFAAFMPPNHFKFLQETVKVTCFFLQAVSGLLISGSFEATILA
jgi:hypothetical protein